MSESIWTPGQPQRREEKRREGDSPQGVTECVSKPGSPPDLGASFTPGVPSLSTDKPGWRLLCCWGPGGHPSREGDCGGALGAQPRLGVEFGRHICPLSSPGCWQPIRGGGLQLSLPQGMPSPPRGQPHPGSCCVWIQVSVLLAPMATRQLLLGDGVCRQPPSSPPFPSST